MFERAAGFTDEELARIERESFVRRIDYHHVLESTNDRALLLAADPASPTPALVLTAQQTAGRGRGSRRWWSAPGALTFSVVIDTAAFGFTSERMPLVSLAAALAVHDAVSLWHPAGPLHVKWPNDVYLNRRKVCGILLEVPAQDRTRAVIGIGLNVNNSLRQAPAELREQATSLCDALGHPLDRTDVLCAVLGRLGIRCAMLADEQTTLEEDWSRVCLLSGHVVTVQGGERRIVGRCLGINRMGHLRLATQAGEVAVPGGTVVSIDD